MYDATTKTMRTTRSTRTTRTMRTTPANLYKQTKYLKNCKQMKRMAVTESVKMIKNYFKSTVVRLFLTDMHYICFKKKKYCAYDAVSNAMAMMRKASMTTTEQQTILQFT